MRGVFGRDINHARSTERIKMRETTLRHGGSLRVSAVLLTLRVDDVVEHGAELIGEVGPLQRELDGGP